MAFSIHGGLTEDKLTQQGGVEATKTSLYTETQLTT
jgi:hypothetical protein